MRDARLETTDGRWWEVTLLTDDAIERHRFTEDIQLAQGMIVTWLDGTPEVWDSTFGGTGSYEGWAKVMELRSSPGFLRAS